MAGDGPSTSAAPAPELAIADEKFTTAKALRTKDPEQAVRLFSEALELFVKVHGEVSIRCAPAYLEVRASPGPAPSALQGAPIKPIGV